MLHLDWSAYECDVGAANVECTSPIQEVNCPVTFVQSEEVGTLYTCQMQLAGAFS